MLVIFFTVLTIVSCASSAPSRQKRFDVFDSYMGPYYRPYVGAFAGTGYMPQYVFPPYPFFRDPMSWIPSFIPERPWYEGENVCSEEKVMDTSDDMKEWLGLDDPSIDYSHESESCRGNNNKYICYRRITSNGIMKMKVTKYECCLGFVRNPNGPGCIEKTDEKKPKEETQEATTQQRVKMSDQMRYSYVQQKSSSKSRSGVENVPIQ